MATVSENLLTLNAAKAAIKSAIEAKGQDLTDVPFTEYSTAIENISTSNPDFVTKLLNRTLTEVFKSDLDGVFSIKDYIFARCRQLTKVELPDKVTSIADYAFKDCIALSDFSLPAGIFLISQGAFQGCSALTGLAIPAGVSEISSYTFDACTGLTNMTMPNVKKLGVYAFRGCINLVQVTLGNVLTNIANYAFQNCTSLSSIDVPEVPPTLANVNAFNNVPTSCIFYCPTAESLAAYQSATNWNTLTGTYTFMVKE